MILDAALVILAVVGGGWVAIRWADLAPADRWGNLLLVGGLGLSGAVGLAGVGGLAGQAVAAALAAAGFFLLVVRGEGVPREAAESDPAVGPDAPVEEGEGDGGRPASGENGS